jgi:glycosyltransferase involved in cell wall biosynthesis
MARRVQETYDRTPRQSTHRLKVCFASPYAYGMLRPASGLPIGGAEVQICALARELAGDDQFDVSILTSHGSRRGLEREGALTIRLAPLWGQSDPTVGTKAGGEAAPLQIQKQADGRTLREQCPPVLVVIARPIARAWFTALRAWTSVYAPVRQWTSDRFHEGRSLWQWVRAIKSMDADVYVMRCASPQVAYARLASWLWHRKFVYMVAHEIDLSGVYVRQQGTWGKRFEWGLRHADLIICQHEGQVRLLHERYDRAGCMLRSLCPPAPDADGMPQRHMILWVARMDAWKQPDIFVELAARIPERSFVMVGPPSETEPADMAALRDRMAGLPNLTWIPGLPFEQVGRLFREALLFVNTSRAEGFPNTFLQAAASRVPIVSWSVDPDDVLERHGLGYCAGGNWKQFEQSVRLVAADIGLRERLGDNGQRYISERHDNARIARGFRELLLSLCKRPAPVDAPGPVDETLEPMTCKEIKL